MTALAAGLSATAAVVALASVVPLHGGAARGCGGCGRDRAHPRQRVRARVAPHHAGDDRSLGQRGSQPPRRHAESRAEVQATRLGSASCARPVVRAHIRRRRRVRVLLHDPRRAGRRTARRSLGRQGRRGRAGAAGRWRERARALVHCVRAHHPGAGRRPHDPAGRRPHASRRPGARRRPASTARA